MVETPFLRGIRFNEDVIVFAFYRHRSIVKGVTKTYSTFTLLREGVNRKKNILVADMSANGPLSVTKICIFLFKPLKIQRKLGHKTAYFIAKNLFCLKLAKIRMCTQCTLYSLSVPIFYSFYLYNFHIKECTFDIFDKPILQA